MHEEILALAKALSQPAEAELPLLEALCAAAEAELAGGLREGLAPEDCSDAFRCAAALLATAALLPGREAGEALQFTAGEVSLRAGGGCETAAALRRQAEALMAPYRPDGGFAFLGVRG